MGSGQPPPTWERGGAARPVRAQRPGGQRRRARRLGPAARSRGQEARDVVEPGDGLLARPATRGCVTLGKALPSPGFWGTVGGA